MIITLDVDKDGEVYRICRWETPAHMSVSSLGGCGISALICNMSLAKSIVRVRKQCAVDSLQMQEESSM